MSLRASLENLRAWRRFVRLPAAQRGLVVYSEGPDYWPHLGPVVEAFLGRHELPLTYVSSRGDDPGAQMRHPRLSAHVIGDGITRVLFFNELDAGLVLMTMPDLNTFHIKRSRRARRYVYLHHSLVSSHMVYREGAFDHFDAVLCAGPHHDLELRAIEALRGLPAKQLVAHGYGRLDTLMASRPHHPAPPDRRVVVVAPSWGPQGLLERHADELLQPLAGCGWEVIVRPHPQTSRLAPEAIERVRHWCARAPNIRLEIGVGGHASFQRASLMVSDWSGAAFDFALGLERPVLFVDVPRKVNNPAYERLQIEPIEVFGRQMLGQVVPVDDLCRLPSLLQSALESEAQHVHSIREFRQRWVNNPGRSAEVAADWLAEQVLLLGPLET